MTALGMEINAKALKMGIPLSVQLDLTYRCNERCIHCYLDHSDHGEMNTAEIKDLLAQMADAGVFYLTISGGEILMRRDFFQILEYARAKTFCIKLKTNGVLIRAKEAERIRSLGVESVQISIYSHRPEVHDAITKMPGSLRQSIDAMRLLRSHGLHVIVANVLMSQNVQDQAGVRALALELGAQYTVDPTITPMMDGDRSILSLNVDEAALREVFRNEALVGNVEEFCAPPQGADEEALNALPCSAGHTACYVSPYGDVYPCVQFPLPSGNVRRTRFVDIWRDSPQLNEVRSITLRDLPSCSKCAHGGSCTRCPGLAYMEGNMRGPSYQDCEKSYARTGIPSENLKAKKKAAPVTLIQIHGIASAAPPQVSAHSH
ncbi:MAG TPA: radical SAM protein [Candidatus Eremiobacteraceae bacterium]|nr:radical SAM protein [Candidatus Eremiobacteraceae bacterium]